MPTAEKITINLTRCKHHQGVCWRCQWGYYDENLRCQFCDEATDAQVAAWKFEHYVKRGVENENGWTSKSIKKPATHHDKD